MSSRFEKLKTRYRGLSGNVFALSLVSLLNDTSSEIIYPLLPTFLTLTLGVSVSAIGVIEGFAESVASLLKLFSGYFSDRFNKRKILVFIGYALAAVTRPFLGFAGNWQQVLAVRVTDRVGKGIRGTPRDALIADSVAPEKRGLAFGFNRAADHLGAVIGPLCATVLLYFLASNATDPTADDYRRVFLFASVPVVLGLFVILFLVRESPHSELKTGTASPIRLSLSEFDGNFKRYLVVVALFTLSNSTDAFLLLRAQKAGVAAALLPILWMALHLSKVLFSLIGGDLSDRFGRKKLILAGWAVYAAVYAAFAFVDSAWQAWALFLVYGSYFGLTEGVEKALVADLVPPEKRGTAFGFYNLAFSVTVLPASILFGLMWENLGTAPAFLISAAISVAAGLLLTTVKTDKLQEV